MKNILNYLLFFILLSSFAKADQKTILENLNYELLLQIGFIIAILIIFLLYRQYLLKTSNRNLQLLVEEKTKELTELNKTLEEKIKKATLENRKKEKLLIQKNKLADMGNMIKTIAHQWRQPLATSNMAITLLKTKNKQYLLTKEEIETKLNTMESLNLHMSQTIEDFLSFFNPKKSGEVFSLKTSVEKTLELLEPQIQKLKIQISLNIEKDLMMDSFLDDYIQVLISIITNSFQAYKENQVKKLFINAKVENESIYLEISDNAGGIPEDIIDNIFNPNFTTKYQADGTGLGLYISKMIIENKMGGTLSVDNIQDGALFTIMTKKEG